MARLELTRFGQPEVAHRSNETTESLPRFGKQRPMLERGIVVLFLDYREDLAPNGPQAGFERWEIVCDQAMKFRKIVERNCGVHVVFDMVVHLPIEKLGEPVHFECPRIESEVSYIVHQSDMLRRGAEKSNRTAVRAGECHQHRNHPQTCGETDRR